MAVKLGYLDVDEMLSKISWLKFLEWMAFSEIDPFDEWRADLRAAQIVAKIHNLFAEKPRPVSDFVLDFDRKPKRRQTVEEQKAIAYQIAYAFTSKD